MPKKLNGKYPGPTEFIKAMATIKLDAPRGPVELDPATKSPIQNIYIKKVEKKKMFGYDNDELWDTVIKTYPAVGTFWHYDKSKFLSSRSTAAISRRVNSVSETDDHQCPLLALSGHDVFCTAHVRF